MLFFYLRLTLQIHILFIILIRITTLIVKFIINLRFGRSIVSTSPRFITFFLRIFNHIIIKDETIPFIVILLLIFSGYDRVIFSLITMLLLSSIKPFKVFTSILLTIFIFKSLLIILLYILKPLLTIMLFIFVNINLCFTLT